MTHLIGFTPELRSRGTLAIVCAVVGIAATVGVGVALVSNPTVISVFLLAGIIVGVALWATWQVHRRTNDAMALLTFLAGYHVLGYAAGALYLYLAGDPNPTTPINAPDVALPLLIASIAWCGLVVGYLGSPIRHLRLSIATEPPTTITFPFLLRIGTIAALGWGARAIEIANGTYFHTIPAGGEVVSTGSSWWIATAATLPTLVMALVGAHAYLRKSGRLARAVFLILVLLEIAWYVPSGSRAALLGIVVTVVVIAHYGGRRIPRKTLAVTALLFVFFVFPFYLAYRGNNDTYQSRPGEALAGALDSVLSGGPTQLLVDGLESTFTRFADVRSGAVALRGGEELFTRAPGETLSWTLYSIVPRAWAPDKPDPGLFGNEFGRSFGIISPYDYVTSITFGQPYELFMNFGWVGVAIGAVVIGILYRVINDMTANRRTNAAALALYSTSVLTVTMGLGVIVAHGLAGAFKLMALYWLILFFVGGGLRFAERADTADLPGGFAPARTGTRPMREALRLRITDRVTHDSGRHLGR